MAERAFTSWSPDTCGCTIEFYNDDGSFRSTVSACQKHSDVADTEKHLSDLLNHNRTKNHVLNDLVKTYGLNLEETPIAVGYDPTADKNNDPIVVAGLKEAFQKKGGINKTEDEAIQDVATKLNIKVQKATVAAEEVKI